MKAGKDTKNIKNIIINGLLSVVFLMVCLIGALQPYMEDDYGYYRQFHTEPFFQTVSGMYMNWSGRMLNLFVMKFTTVNEFSFYLSGVINGIAFILTVYLIVTCALGRFPAIFSYDRIIFLLAFSAVWFGLPALGETVFWRSGAGGYLWPMLSALALLTPFVLWYKSEKQAFHANPYGVLMIPAGFIAGISHEQIVISLTFLFIAWLVFIIYFKKAEKKVPYYLYAGLVSFIAGAAVLFLAPGNYKRLSAVTVNLSFINSLGKQIGDFVIYVIGYGALNLWVWLALILTAALILNKNIKDRKNDFIIWLSAAFVSILLVILFPLGGQRPMYFYVIFITMSFISLLNAGKERIKEFHKQNISTAVMAFLTCILITDCAFGLFSNIYLSVQMEQRRELIETSKQKGVAKITVPPIYFRESHITFASDNPNRIFLENSVTVDYSSLTGDYRPKNIIDELKVHYKDIYLFFTKRK